MVYFMSMSLCCFLFNFINCGIVQLSLFCSQIATGISLFNYISDRIRGTL